MTKEEAINIIKSECYVFNPLNFDKSTMVNTALDMAIKALEKEPCTVDAKPIVHAHWDVIDQDSEGDEVFAHIWATLCCSRCGMERTTEDGYIPQYCESCGAKMDE